MSKKLQLTVVFMILDLVKSIDLYLKNYFTLNRIWNAKQSTYLKQKKKNKK